MSTVQALLSVVCALSVPVSLFLLSDKLSARKRAKRTERALAQQILIEKMKKASEMDLADAVRCLSDVGIFTDVHSSNLIIVVPELFWGASAETVSQALVTVVKGGGFGVDICSWTFALQDLLIAKAGDDPRLAIKVTAHIAKLDSNMALLMAR